MAVEWENLFSVLGVSWDPIDNIVVINTGSMPTTIFVCNTVPPRSPTDTKNITLGIADPQSERKFYIFKVFSVRANNVGNLQQVKFQNH